MKVVGTGEPRTLTVRVQACEVALWRETLRRRLALMADAGSEDDASITARLLADAGASRPPSQPWVLTGPTRLLAPVVQAVAALAVERYMDRWLSFAEAPNPLTGDSLRIALDTMSATVATAIALARVLTDAAA